MKSPLGWDLRSIEVKSTVDSLLLLASSAVVLDTMQKIVGSTKNDESLARYGKAVTILIGLVGVMFALEETKLIFWFILFAWSGLGAAFGPVIICMLYYKKTNLPGVATGMLGGFLTSVIWVLVFKTNAYDLYEMIPGFIVGITMTVLVSKMTREKAAI